jgi:hypothetical protein
MIFHWHQKDQSICGSRCGRCGLTFDGSRLGFQQLFLRWNGHQTSTELVAEVWILGGNAWHVLSRATGFFVAKVHRIWVVRGSQTSVAVAVGDGEHNMICYPVVLGGLTAWCATTPFICQVCRLPKSTGLSCNDEACLGSRCGVAHVHKLRYIINLPSWPHNPSQKASQEKEPIDTDRYSIHGFHSFCLNSSVRACLKGKVRTQKVGLLLWNFAISKWKRPHILDLFLNNVSKQSVLSL